MAYSLFCDLGYTGTHGILLASILELCMQHHDQQQLSVSVACLGLKKGQEQVGKIWSLRAFHSANSGQHFPL